MCQAINVKLRARAGVVCLSLLCAMLLLSTCGCKERAERVRATDEGEIVVAAAANLTDAFGEIGRAFTSETGIRVVYSFGATADLTRQVENGAPFDVFAAADETHVVELERKGFLTQGTRALYARGRLVLWTPPDGRVRLSRLEDLSRSDVKRIAVGKPDVAPYGQAAVEALRALNLWESIEPKVVYAQNVSQARQFAASGNADAAFLPRALVRAGEGEAFDVDERLHQPINQAAAVLRASVKQDASRRFLRYVLGDKGQAILERYGYRRPDTAKR